MGSRLKMNTRLNIRLFILSIHEYLNNIGIENSIELIDKRVFYKGINIAVKKSFYESELEGFNQGLRDILQRLLEDKSWLLTNIIRIKKFDFGIYIFTFKFKPKRKPLIIGSHRSSFFKGISYNKRGKCWKPAITYKHKLIQLPIQKVEADAAQVYDYAAIKLYGKDVKTNFWYDEDTINKILAIPDDIFWAKWPRGKHRK